METMPIQPKIEVPTLKDFLNVLFPNLESEYIEVRLLNGSLPLSPKFFSCVDDLISELPVLKAMSGYDVYFGVCPRKEHKGNKGAVSRIHVLWLDLDAKDHQEGKSGILDKLRTFPLKPTAVVDSGNGFHVYWALKEPETDKALVEAYLKALCQALGGDKSSCEVARILRLPETFNRKDSAKPLSVRVVQLNPEAQYNLGDFDFLPLAVPLVNGDKLSGEKPNDWIAEALSNLSEGNRNTTFASIIGRLHRDELTASAILALLKPHAEKCHFPEDELQREVNGICNRYPASGLISPNSLNSHQHSEKKWPKTLRDEAYYGLAGDIVRLITPHSEADPAALLVQSLVMFGNVIGRTAHFVAEADRHFMNTFVVLVGKTAKGRKGSSLGQIKRLFESIDPDWALNRTPSGLSSGEGLIWAVRDEITRKDPIKVKGRVIDYEEVIVDEGILDKRLLIVEAEFASTLRVLERDGNTLSALVRQAWDTGTLRALTKNFPAKSTDAHISIIAHITKIELCRYMNRTEAANGFGNRFLWICVQRSKELPEGGKLQTVDFAPTVQRLNDAVKFARTVGELKRNEGAKELWLQKYSSLSKETPGLVGALTARAEAQVMRLACIYALLDCSTAIRVEHLRAALALWDYAESSVSYIFGDSFGDPVADTILSALRSSPKGLSRTEISNLFGRHASPGQIPRALGVLQELGLADMKTETTGGRPQEIWVAVAKEAKNANEEIISRQGEKSELCEESEIKNAD